MPPFAQQPSDADVAEVVIYLRRSWSNCGAIVGAEQVREL
jgi:hypothetical protein